MPRNEHEAVMEALSTDGPEILNETEGVMHDNYAEDMTTEEIYFLDNNSFFED